MIYLVKIKSGKVESQFKVSQYKSPYFASIVVTAQVYNFLQISVSYVSRLPTFSEQKSNPYVKFVSQLSIAFTPPAFRNVILNANAENTV